jgi:LAO/AO transport system kinase
MSKFRNLLLLMKGQLKSRLKLSEYIQGILASDRVMLGRAITLVESLLISDRKLSEEIVEKLLPKTGHSIRIGITGVPGAGKSTFIEVFGKMLTSQNKKVAVLTVDPSSQKTKGSILGDKTRMEELAKDPLAFIRPSATGNTLGGVASSTRQAILLCEAAGYEIIIVETVGVGQSETTVRSMTDFFLLLMLPGAGDELQGIKKGIMEMADGLAITKADGDNVKRAQQTKSDYAQAMHLFPPPESGVIPRIITTSALERRGIKETWEMIIEFKEKTTARGFFNNQRQSQNVRWFHEHIEWLMKSKMLSNKKVLAQITQLEKKIAAFKISPTKAAQNVIADHF